jgi:hypothetical protein
MNEEIHLFSDTPRNTFDKSKLKYKNGNNKKGLYVVDLPVVCEGTPRKPRNCVDLGVKIGKSSGQEGIQARFSSYHLVYKGMAKVRYIKTFHTGLDAEKAETNLIKNLKGRNGRGNPHRREYYDNEIDVRRAIENVPDFNTPAPPKANTRANTKPNTKPKTRTKKKK